MRQALAPWRVQPWPWDGAIGLEERDGRLRQIHVLRHWSYLGSARTLAQARLLASQQACFDADVYRIALAPLRSADAKLRML
jgi:excinuclease Cho